jgi:hypothetical protein
LYEMARKTPGGLGPVPEVQKAIEHDEGLLAAYRPDCFDLAVEERLELVLGVIEWIELVMT